MSDIPEPEDSGVSGTQSIGGKADSTQQLMPPLARSVAGAVEGLAASRPRALGGDATAALIAGALSQLSHELEVAQRNVDAKDQRIQVLSDELTRCKIKIASLEAEIGASGRTRALRHFSIFAGTALLGVGVDLMKGNLIVASALVGIIGLGLLVFGASSTKSGE